MFTILQKSLSLVFFIVLGQVFKRVGILKKDDFQVFSKVMMRVTLPCSIIYNFSRMSIDISLFSIVLIGIVMNVLTMATGYLLNRASQTQNRPFDMLNLSGFNIGCFALPFAQSFLGPVGLVSVNLFDTGNSFMCTGINYTVTQFVKDRQQGVAKIDIPKILRDLLSSVPFDTYVVMVFMVLLGLPIPSFVGQTAAVGANANAFIAMLIIGISIDFMIDWTKLKRIVRLLAARLIISVSAAALFMALVFIPVEIRQALALVSLAPISAVAPAFTEKLGEDVGLAGTLNSLSIVCSIVMLTVALMLIL